MVSAQLRNRSRAGAIYAFELLLVLPLLLMVAAAILEFSFLWSANWRVKEASRAAARIASLPASSVDELRQAATVAATQALDHRPLVENLQMQIEPGLYTGDAVFVEVVVPMSAAAPDLLNFFGFSLRDRVLRGRTVMRKE